MLNRCLTLTGLIVALVMFPSCGGKPLVQKDTMLERNWGRSYESAKYNQMLNPEAGKNLEPVVGTDGQTAERNIEKYRLYEVSGVNRYFIEEFSSSTFEYQRRHVDKDRTYTYELNAVDNKGRTGDAATLNINGTLVKTDLDVMMDMIGLVWFIQF